MGALAGRCCFYVDVRERFCNGKPVRSYLGEPPVDFSKRKRKYSC